jgi:hypothetical protein
MLAGEFTARARAAECWLTQIDLHPVWIFATALAFTPYRMLTLAKLFPFAELC